MIFNRHLDNYVDWCKASLTLLSLEKKKVIQKSAKDVIGTIGNLEKVLKKKKKKKKNKKNKNQKKILKKKKKKKLHRTQ